MNERFSQQDRLMRVQTPLGKDALLLAGFRGQEAISELFAYELELLAENGAAPPFRQLLGEPVVVELGPAEAPIRYFHGIVKRIVQRGRDERFTRYSADVVPEIWPLTRNVQSRVFQNRTAPEILQAVFEGKNFVFNLQETYLPHNYCVQYHESDFAFAARLMEEEGIFFHFEHHAEGCRMHIRDNSRTSHPIAAPVAVRFNAVDGGVRNEQCIYEWEKTQELCVGKVEVADFSFQIPRHELTSRSTVAGTVHAGSIEHHLHHRCMEPIERYENAGGFAHRFDEVHVSGREQPERIEDMYRENQRLGRLHAEREMASSIRVDGVGSCQHFQVGHRFQLADHFDADGDYLITRLDHVVRLPGFVSDATPFRYENRFSCIPIELAYRHPCSTPIPKVQGAQTATVVGPPNEEIWTDKYGRIQVHFHWDRGANDGKSSCWVRVAHGWAGRNFGHIHIPRVGQEVVIEFIEGDLDHPLVVGSVYNADQMPPILLPESKTQSGIKTQTYAGGSANFHGIGFEDAPGKEHLQVHSERDMTQSSEQNMYLAANQGQHSQVGRRRLHRVGSMPVPYRAPIGAHVSTSAPEGSGSGGGGVSDFFKNIATDQNLTLGVSQWSVVGMTDGFIMGSALYSAVNPLAFLAPANFMASEATGVAIASACGPFLAPALLGASASGGYAQAMIGGATDITYGPRFTSYRGGSWDVTGPLYDADLDYDECTSSTLTRVLCSLYAIDQVVITVYLAEVKPDDWAEEFGSDMMSVSAHALYDLLVASEMINRANGVAASAVQPPPQPVPQPVATISTKVAVAAMFLSFVAEAVKSVIQAGIFLALQYGASKASGSGSGSGMPSTPTPANISVHGYDYVVDAPNVTLNAIQGTPEISGCVAIKALGDDGVTGDVFVQSTHDVTIVAGSLAYIELQTDVAVGVVTIDCGVDGTIFLQSGEAKEPNDVTIGPEGILVSSLEMITLESGETTQVINPEEGFTFTFGENVITINESGIALVSGDTSLAITPEGISINGPVINIAADGDLNMEGADVSIDAAALEIDAAAVSIA